MLANVLLYYLENSLYSHWSNCLDSLMKENSTPTATPTLEMAERLIRPLNHKLSPGLVTWPLQGRIIRFLFLFSSLAVKKSLAFWLLSGLFRVRSTLFYIVLHIFNKYWMRLIMISVFFESCLASVAW